VTRDELIALASPSCHECERPVQRVETRWTIQGDDWVPMAFTMVCADGHRVLVEHLDADV
jgi:hypothetical protein